MGKERDSGCNLRVGSKVERAEVSAAAAARSANTRQGTTHVGILTPRHLLKTHDLDSSVFLHRPPTTRTLYSLRTCYGGRHSAASQFLYQTSTDHGSWTFSPLVITGTVARKSHLFFQELQSSAGSFQHGSSLSFTRDLVTMGSQTTLVFSRSALKATSIWTQPSLEAFGSGPPRPWLDATARRREMRIRGGT